MPMTGRVTHRDEILEVERVSRVRACLEDRHEDLYTPYET